MALFIITSLPGYSQYLPLAGGTMTGNLNLNAGLQIQTPYLGFNSLFSQPANSSNVALFPNSSSGSLDIVGWSTGWRFIPSNASAYPAPVVIIDNSGNTNILGNTYVGKNMGIGTTAPGAVLDVATPLTPGALGTVLARLSEGNSQGAGTYLGIKGYNTQLSGNISNINNVVSFAIEHSFYGYTNSSINFLRGGNSVGGSISFNTNNNTEVMRLLYTGNVLIGQTSQVNSSYKLDVNGNVRANQIVVNATGADFVFAPKYKLPSLLNLKRYIDQNHHLPEILTAKQMQADGLNVGDNQIKLLQKVEELTLYLIQKDHEVTQLKGEVDQLKQQMALMMKKF